MCERHRRDSGRATNLTTPSVNVIDVPVLTH